MACVRKWIWIVLKKALISSTDLKRPILTRYFCSKETLLTNKKFQVLKILRALILLAFFKKMQTPILVALNFVDIFSALQKTLVLLALLKNAKNFNANFLFCIFVFSSLY